MQLRDAYTEAGVAVMALASTEQLLQHAHHAFSHAEFLHYRLGVSKGLSVLVVALLVFFQIGAVIALVLPRAYLLVGSILPSALLVACLWTDALLFGDGGDRIVILRCACFTLAAALTSLFRYDRRARNAQLQVPNGGLLLAIESYVRRACTALRTSYYCPVVGVALFAYGFLRHGFWSMHGMRREDARSRWHFLMSLASAFLLQAAQDGNRVQLWQAQERATRLLRRVFPRHDDLLSIGKKKAI